MANLLPSPPKNLPPWAQKSVNWLGRLSRPPVLSTLATSLLVLGLRAGGALQGLELGAYDQMMRLRPTPGLDDRILVVGIDEIDIQTRREWPIQDSTIVELLDDLVAAEPRAIGLDMFRDVPIGEGHDALLQLVQDNELIFPVCKISSTDTPGVPPPDGTPDTRVGFSDLVVDPGGILRQSLLVAMPPADAKTVGTHLCNDPEFQHLSLSLRLALSYLAAEGIELAVTPDYELKLGDTVLSMLEPNMGGYHNADTRGYQIMLNYRAPKNAVPQVSLSEVVAGQVPASEIRDRIVLVGATTPEAKDEFYTPFSGGLRDNQKMPGVIVHAQAASQIISAVLDDRPLIWSWSTAGEVTWIVVWALGGAFFAWYVRRPLRYAFGAVFLLGGLYGICYVLFLQGGWIPLVPAALSLILASGGVVLLERINKSDYGQAVYKQMKSLLRLEIEIDQSRVGEQVAQITDTDYFNRLQAQAKELRDKRQAQSAAAPTPPSTANSKSQASPPAPAETDSVDSLVDNLKERAKRLRNDSESEKSSE